MMQKGGWKTASRWVGASASFRLLRSPRKRWIALFLGLFFACSALSVTLTGCWVWQRYGNTPTEVATVPAPVQPSPGDRPSPVPSRTPLPTTTPTMAPTPTPTPTPEPSTLANIRAALPLPVRDLYTLGHQLGKVGDGVRRLVNPGPPSYEIGAQESFWIAEETGKTYFEITATLRLISEHAAWWVQNGLNYNPEGLKRAAKTFEQQTLPTNHKYFGTEWSPGVDGDPRIHIVNGQLSRGIGGYYSSADEYPNAINPHSNQREAIYINLDAYRPGNRRYDAVIAHEFQHMIHWHNDPNESTWVDEGAAELAVHLNGYDEGRWAPVFADQPDTQLNAWAEETGAAGAHYGASHLLMLYFAQRFGPDRVRALISAPQDGIAGFDAVLAGEGLSFDEVFQDWVAANYLDDPSLADGRYGYDDVNVDARIEQTLTAGQRWSDQVHQYATDYLALAVSPDKGPALSAIEGPALGVVEGPGPGTASATVQFTGTTTVPVLATQPHSGRYFFWSNRGDGSVTSLTRAFDLTGVVSATLETWLWYDIEEYFDFAYVEVSTDGGATWRIVEGQHTTTENPTGNALGPGYTGHSGGGQTPGWIEESIDLTPFAGRRVLVRWEMVTDDGYNAPGLAIDDVALPQIGYFEDFEKGNGGWLAEGFVRIDNVLPQRWALQLLRPGRAPAVTRIPVREGRATFRVDGDAVLAVSAMTPFTTETAEYTISVVSDQ